MGSSHGRASSEHGQHPCTWAQHPLPKVQGEDHRSVPTTRGATGTCSVFRGPKRPLQE